MRIVAILAALTVLVAAQAAAPARSPAEASTPLLGAVWLERDAQLTHLDPSTLAPVGARVSLGTFGAWAPSPAGDRIAVGRMSPAAIRLVDTTRMALLATVKVAPSGSVSSIAWLGPNRLVVIYAHYDGDWIAWVDAQAHRVLKRAKLGAAVAGSASGGGRFVALLQPSTRIGVARLAVASAAGRLGVIRLGSIRIGTQAAKRNRTDAFRRVQPGLVVDPSGSRAYVVGTEGVVSVVDLRSLAVATHRLRQPAARAPAAASKSISGPLLDAQWVGGGRLAVVGTSYRATVDKAGEHQFATPLGLRLVDVRTWTQRTIDPSATGVTLADGALLAYGVLTEWGSGTTSYAGMGIAAYGADGSARSRILAGQPVTWVQASGGRAYGWLADERSAWHVLVVDLTAGTVERDLTLGRPTRLLLGEGAAY